MKKILIILGSNQIQERSVSYKIAEMVKGLYETKYSDSTVEVIHLVDCDINMCKGCMCCFQTGKCVLKDDIDTIKEKMLEADHIMLISPVYAHNVSGVMKNFIDRISSWIHILKLTGKSSSTIAITSTNGQMFVTDYLKKILELLGSIYIRGIEIPVHCPPMFDKLKDLELVLDRFITRIHGAMEGELDLKSVERQSAAFNLYKTMYDNCTVDCFEAKEWNADEALKKSSFLSAYYYRIGGTDA